MLGSGESSRHLRSFLGIGSGGRDVANKTSYLKCYKFPETLRRKIVESGLSVREVAHGLGMSKNTVHCWLNGVTEPRLGEAVVLADILNCSLLELVGGTET